MVKPVLVGVQVNLHDPFLMKSLNGIGVVLMQFINYTS